MIMIFSLGYLQQFFCGFLNSWTLRSTVIAVSHLLSYDALPIQKIFWFVKWNAFPLVMDACLVLKKQGKKRTRLNFFIARRDKTDYFWAICKKNLRWLHCFLKQENAILHQKTRQEEHLSFEYKNKSHAFLVITNSRSWRRENLQGLCCLTHFLRSTTKKGTHLQCKIAK